MIVFRYISSSQAVQTLKLHNLIIRGNLVDKNRKSVGHFSDTPGKVSMLKFLISQQCFKSALFYFTNKFGLESYTV